MDDRWCVQNIDRNRSGTSLYKCKKTPTHLTCCCYPTKQEKIKKEKTVLFIIQNTAKQPPPSTRLGIPR